MKPPVTKGTGNVYADLEPKDAESHALMAKLVHQITVVMKERGLSQKKAAQQMSIEQPDVSHMLRGHFRQFSLGRLMRFLVVLGCEVEIVVGPAPAARDAQLTVSCRG